MGPHHPRVMTIEWIDGIPINDLAAIDAAPADLPTSAVR